ncbi:hypothetical protein PVW53_12875 [Seohaeicola sp. SP36]|uniref:hypothetical protein n=1 Tax=unclassified Seohaeicola TaxID=2641111 RepID=UPI00237B8EFB|nr:MULTISPECIES: hypothetical protein [unclassified Seohaeicola]MDD9708427.1 hypothetical protein [Seohaeicola sp. 4SK31]MDD9736419.1 hypothetical protein [Seohaeicola sp. SP36]
MNDTLNGNDLCWPEVADSGLLAMTNCEIVDAGVQLPLRPPVARKAAVGAKKHFTCDIVFGLGAGEVMRLNSLTEKRVALVLLARPDVMKVENQVPHYWIDEKGSRHTHFFDLRATLVDGRRIAIMVKYDKKLEQDEFRALIARISSQVFPAFADRVTIMTERDLDPIELYNATLVNSVRHPDPAADDVIRDVVSKLAGAAKISDLIEHTGLGSRGFRSIARLIGSHELKMQKPERIHHDAHVFVQRAA